MRRLACGNKDMVNAVLRVKSNIDSGITQAIQQMAIAALSGDQSVIEANNQILQGRRDKVVAALEQIGLEVLRSCGPRTTPGLEFSRAAQVPILRCGWSRS